MSREQSSPLPWHKHSRLDTQSQAREVDPADDLFEGFAGNAAGHEIIESPRGPARCLQEDRRFVFGEDAAGGAQ